MKKQAKEEKMRIQYISSCQVSSCLFRQSNAIIEKLSIRENTSTMLDVEK